MNDIYKVIAKVWPAIAESEKREAAQLRRWVVETAEDAMKSDEVSAERKELVASHLEDFKECFDYVANGSADKIAALGMLEDATIIFTISPPDSEVKQRIASSTLHAFRSKGGKQRSKDRLYASWKKWREGAMKETKAMLRADLGTSRAKVLLRLCKLNPGVSKSTLERTVDGWKEEAKRLQKILRH